MLNCDLVVYDLESMATVKVIENVNSAVFYGSEYLVAACDGHED